VIDISDGIGKEVITKYTTPMATNQYFYTDANGLEIQQRRRNFRPTWPFVNTEPAVCSFLHHLTLLHSIYKKHLTVFCVCVFVIDFGNKQAGNYFPVNSVIYLTDGQRQLSLVTDRSHGGSSLVDGKNKTCPKFLTFLIL
jgi:lysosomal alpha-mannosidase